MKGFVEFVQLKLRYGIHIYNQVDCKCALDS